MKQIRLNIVVIGSGLASLSFIDKYLEKKNRYINLISPNFKKLLTKKK